MKGLLKLVAGLGVLVIVLIVAGGAILGAFFDPNEYKPEIEKAALKEGGIELKINGDIGWSVFPWLGLEVNKIDVKFPGKNDLASLNKAQLAVRIPALISGKVEMKSIVVDGLQLNLVKEKDGSTNWIAEVSSTVSSESETNTKTETGTEKSSSPAIALNIDSIQISNGNINYLDKSTDTQALLSDFNMSSGQVVTNAFFPAELSFNATQLVKGEEQVKAAANLSAEFFLDLDNQLYKIKGLDSKFNLSGKPLAGKSLEITSTANIEANLATQQLTLSDLTLSLANLKATGNLAVSSFAAPIITGKLSVASFDLNKLLTSIGQAEIETTDSDALSAISFNTELAGPANTVTAKTLNLTLDDTKFSGSAAFNLANSNISLNIQGDKLDADRYMPPATDKKASEASTAEKSASTTASTGYSKDEILPIDTLRSLALDLSVGLKALHVANLDVSNILVKVSAHNGLIKASKIDADLYKGSVKNNVTIDVRNNTPIITSQKSISGIQIGDMLKALADVDQLTGSLNSQSNLTLRGNSVFDFVNSVTGTADVNMKDGELHGIDMAQTVCQGLNNLSSLGVNTTEVDKSTPFANMGASANIKNGVINNQDLKAALDAMSLSGKGTVNLPKQLLDYRLGFMVEKNLFKETCSFPDKLEGVEIPIDCKGSFDTDPVKLCKPDFSFISDALKNQVKEKVEAQKAEVKEKVEAKKEEAKEKLKDKLDSKLKGLF
jgi:AsmA protein